MLRIRLNGLFPRIAALAVLPLAAVANPIITDVIETGGVNEPTDTVTAKWTGVTFSNGIAGEFQNPFLIPLFGEDVPAYVDRTHQWNGATVDLPLPPYLVGGEYIMIGNDNRDRASLKLDVTVSEEVDVFVLVDNRLSDGGAGDPPFTNAPLDQWTLMTWLGTNGFAPVITGYNRNGAFDIPDEIGVDEGGNGTGPGGDIQNYSSIYSARKPAGTFSLYQADNGGRNMYGVVIKRPPGSLNSPPEVTLNAPTNNTLFYNAAGGVSFTAKTTSPNSIAPSAISLSLNGVNATPLNITGTSDNRTATFSGLTAGTAYRATVIATDQAGHSSTNQFSFDTFDSAAVIAIEAEDYNYGGGQTKPDPIAPNSYTDLAGTADVDIFDLNISAAATTYRAGEFVGLGTASDVARDSITSVGGTDFVVNQVEAGEWLNYTRTVPAGTYKIYLREAAGSAQKVQLDKVSGATTSSQTLTPLGTFNLTASIFGYTPLTDVGGHPVNVTLGGETTFRLTALSSLVDLQLNYLLLVPTTDAASGAYVASGLPVGGTETGDATVRAAVVNGTTTAAGATLALDGADVTAGATITSSASGFVGTYDPPGTLAAGAHTLSLVLTDSVGTKTTNDWSFTVASAVTLPTNIKTTSGTGVGPGFNVKIHKIDNGITTLANSAARAEQQLAGAIVDSTGVAYENQAAGPNGDGLSTNLVLNFQQQALSAGYVGADEGYPYIDTSVDPNNIALEATAYLEMAAGSYRFGVRSDDGFRLTVGPTFGTASQLIAQFEGGRGDGVPGGATEFNVTVPEAGLYPARLIYYEGNGGASLELYTIDPVTQKRTLVNAADSPVKAFTARNTQIFVPTVAITAPADKVNYPLNVATNIEIKVDAAVQGGTIAKVEYFSGTNKIGEATSSPFTFTWTSAPIGKYTLTAKATDSTGFSTTSAKVNVSVGTALSINFQATTATTPEGYLADLGDVFGDRGNGYNYGWDDDNTANARDRNSANSPNELYDTFNHLQKPLPAGRVWEIEIPNGKYQVYGVSGDPDNFDSVFDVLAEDKSFISGPASTDRRFFDGTAVLDVTDGKLTLTNGPLGANNKINFIDIYALPTVIFDPPLGLTATMSGGNVTVTWTGGGTLQFKTDLNAASWSDTGNTTGTFSEPVTTAAAKFFRVAK